MSQERWGTFAVNDHLRRHPFVVDTLLYDRLIIPCPPNDDERQRWMAQGWQPDRLDAYLEILRDFAITVPWDEYKRERFKSRFVIAQDANFDASNLADFQQRNQDPYYLTRMLLMADFLPQLPRGVSKVWAIAAYPSASAYKQDYTADVRQERQETLGLVLTHKFLVPKLSGRSDKNLLKQAVRLASRDDFREKRSEFYQWQETIIEKDIPDDKAIEEMEVNLQEYNKIVKKAVRDVYWKFAFTVIPIGLSIAGATLINPYIAAGAIVSLAKFVKFDRKPVIRAGECAAAAMFYDIHKSFKIEDE